MFDHVVLRRAEGGLPISAGQIAEALLYYQKVQVVIDRGTLLGLIKQIGCQRLLMLLRRPELSAVYCEEMLGTHTEQVSKFEVHKYVAFTLAGHESVGQLRRPEDRLRYELELNGVDKTTTVSFVKSFLKYVPVRTFSGKHFAKSSIVEAAKQDLLEKEFVRLAVRRVIEAAPGGGDPGIGLKFDVLDTDLGLYVFHDIDLDGINARRALLKPKVEPLTIAFILSQIQDARADLALASFYGGDFVTYSTTSAIIQLRYEELLRRTELNTCARGQFEEVVLPDTPTLAEVIDLGERSFDEFLVLLDRAAKFKDWLKSVNPDEGLVRTYMRDVSAEGWIEKLPSKSIRYVFTTVLEATFPSVGLAAGLVDNFVIEKLLRGWRPNHFVSKRLGPFVGE